MDIFDSDLFLYASTFKRALRPVFKFVFSCCEFIKVIKDFWFTKYIEVFSTFMQYFYEIDISNFYLKNVNKNKKEIYSDDLESFVKKSFLVTNYILT